MDSGLVTQETLSEVLRSIAQRRRTGCLDVRYDVRAVRLFFIQGKIVELLEASINPAQEVLKTLKQAGVVAETFVSHATGYGELWSEFCNDPICQHAISLEMVRRATQHRVLGKLYTLDINAPASFEFDASSVRLERDFLPSIPVGQLLLDIVGLESDRAKFESRFKDSTIVKRTGATPRDLSEDEELLYGLLEQDALFPALVQRSTLSAFSIQESLLRMLDEGYIRVEEEKPVLSSSEFLDEHLLQGLDDSIDEAFESEGLLTKARTLADATPAVLDSATAAKQKKAARRSVKQHVAKVSMRMAQTHGVAAFVMWMFLISAVVIPWLLWDGMFVVLGLM